MKRSTWTLTLLIAAVLTTAACLTINVYFPEAAIRDLAEQIEEEVQEGAVEPESAPASAEDGVATSAAFHQLADLVAGVFATTPVYAQDDVPDPGVTNPAIRQIIASRRQRVRQLNELKARGVVGENNQALVEIRNLAAVSDLRQRAEAQRLVKAENSDREKLFREIAATQNVDLSQLPRIKETYAATLRAKARKGDWIQMPDGSWKQK